jgi:diguanylate cyclase (GGDEF)-like protein
MDPRTTLIVVTIMMLLNGGVLGLMHRDLTQDVQPAARDWRIGTLLAAGGCILLATQDSLPHGFILPLGNGCLLGSMALYLRAAQRFDHAPTTPWIFLPIVFGVMGIYWASAVAPSVAMRAIIASAGWVFYLSLIAKSLIAGRKRDGALLNKTEWRSQGSTTYPISRTVLIVMVLVVALCMLIRAIYFALNPHHATSLLVGGQWINTATMILPGALPIVGTTVFIMMCSERLRAKWVHAATTDYLTGLPNRRTISDIAATRLAAAQKSGGALTIALIDIDHFKNINDTYGHDVGDDALKHVAHVLKQQCTISDGHTIVARQGGEEFLSLLAPNDNNMAPLAEQLRHAMESAPFTLGDDKIRITISIGVATTGADETQITHALKRADQALYAAKAKGRNRVEMAF